MAESNTPKRPSRRRGRGGPRVFGGAGQTQEDLHMAEFLSHNEVDQSKDENTSTKSVSNGASNGKKDETLGGLKVNPMEEPKNTKDRFILRGIVNGNPRVFNVNTEKGSAFCIFEINVGSSKARFKKVAGEIPLEKENGEFTNRIKIKDTDFIETIGHMRMHNGKPTIALDPNTITVLPYSNDAGIKKYLMSFNGDSLDLPNGVGEVSAKKYIAEYGKDLSKLNDPENLIKIGWNKEVAERVSLKAKEGERFRELRIELEYTFNLKRNQVTNLINLYGSKLDSILEKNPWSLGLHNISFQILDRIAASRGAPMNSKNRIRVGVAKYVRDIISETGSTCIPIGAILDDEVVSEQKRMSSRSSRLARRTRSAEPVRGVSETTIAERQEAKKIFGKIMSNLDRSRSASYSGASNSGIDIKVIREAIDYLLSEECSQKEPNNALKVYEIGGKSYLYPVENYEKERSLAHKFAAISMLPEKFSREEAVEAVDEVSKNKGIRLSEEQYEAAVNACIYPMCVITGGAGTGKSTIQDIICSALVHLGNKVSLSAPTGKAAKRLAQTTKRPASTIHKQLDFGRVGEGEYDFRRNWENPIPEDAVITDEGSMEDMDLANKHLDAFPVNGSMCIVGDYNQLSSVGAGQVLKDIINTNNDYIKVCRLTQTRRSADDSNLMIGAHKVNRGEDPFENGNVKGAKFIDCSDEEIAETIAMLTAVEASSKGLNYRDGYTALSPIRSKSNSDGKQTIVKGSVPDLNQKMKNIHNPGMSGSGKTKIDFSVGDVVIGTSNNYSLDFRNGEEGIITDIRFNKNNSPEVKVSFDGAEPVTLTYDEGLRDIELAYANTVHKFQGSERDAVYVAIPSSYGASKIMTRNLLYTMFTRASKEITLVGNREKFKEALHREEGRVTNLSGMINEHIAELEAMPLAERVKNNRFLKRMFENRKDIYPPDALKNVEEQLVKEGVDLKSLSSETTIDRDDTPLGFGEFNCGF